MERYTIRIGTDVNFSQKVQKLAFKYGYKWSAGKSEVIDANNYGDKSTISIEKSGMTYGSGECYPVNVSSYEELERLLHGENPKIEKEATTMAKINTVETKHFINGTDIKDITVDQQATFIMDTEKRIGELAGLSTRSVAIEKEIANLKDNLKKAVDLFNTVQG